ncbi:MAG: hypothetical protein GX207_06510 [Peptococcaceae bacterium]|nr:hypothetical protein [Peptococcaceae bacterium]
MSKPKGFFGSVAALVYFLTVMWWVLLLLPFVVLMLFTDIGVIRSSGFSTVNTGISFIAIFGLLLGLSLLIPAFRKMYYKLPWLFPYVKIMYLNLIIMSIAVALLNYGYEVQNPARHTLFFILMIIQIIIFRLLMSLYFSRNRVPYIGGNSDEQ